MVTQEGICNACGKHFSKQIKQHRETKSCSAECRYKSLQKTWAVKVPKINRVCHGCGKDFLVFPCWIKQNRGNDASFCSKKCRWINPMKYTERQKEKGHNRVRVALKQGKLIKQVCIICKDPNTDAHHHKGYADEFLLDVVWLCGKHHNQEHERLRRFNLNSTL